MQWNRLVKTMDGIHLVLMGLDDDSILSIDGADTWTTINDKTEENLLCKPDMRMLRWVRGVSKHKITQSHR